MTFKAAGQDSVFNASSLAQRLQQPKALLAPGVYDALSALIAEQAGFEALYLSGASIAYSRLGRSDIGLTTATEVAQTLAHITDRVAVPVIVDADTGFGNALNTQRTVRDFERAGAAMIQIEDQTFPKRCGHLDGKGVVPVAEMQGKLKAALDARQSSNTLILSVQRPIWPAVSMPCSLKRCAPPSKCSKPAHNLRTAFLCWPTWSRVVKRPFKVPLNWVSAAFEL